MVPLIGAVLKADLQSGTRVFSWVAWMIHYTTLGITIQGCYCQCMRANLFQMNSSLVS